MASVHISRLVIENGLNVVWTVMLRFLFDSDDCFKNYRVSECTFNLEPGCYKSLTVATGSEKTC